MFWAAKRIFGSSGSRQHFASALSYYLSIDSFILERELGVWAKHGVSLGMIGATESHYGRKKREGRGRERGSRREREWRGKMR